MLASDAQLVRDVRMNCGGGQVHAAAQVVAAYEMAIARYNHPRSKDKDSILREVEHLAAELYRMGRRK